MGQSSCPACCCIRISQPMPPRGRTERLAVAAPATGMAKSEKPIPKRLPWHNFDSSTVTSRLLVPAGSSPALSQRSQWPQGHRLHRHLPRCGLIVRGHGKRRLRSRLLPGFGRRPVPRAVFQPGASSTSIREFLLSAARPGGFPDTVAQHHRHRHLHDRCQARLLQDQPLVAA